MILANTIVSFAGNPSIQTPLITVTAYDLVGILIAVVEIGLFIVVTLAVGLKLRKSGV